MTILYRLPVESFIKGKSYIDSIQNITMAGDDEQKVFKAIVRGNQENIYLMKLTLYLADNEVSASCTCMAYESNLYCKHIAAFILLLQRSEQANFDQFSYLDGEDDDFEVELNDFLPKINSFANVESSMKNILDHIQLHGRQQIGKQLKFNPTTFYEDQNQWTGKNPYGALWFSFKLDHFYQSSVTIKIRAQSRLKNGTLGKIKEVRINSDFMELVENPQDVKLLKKLYPFAERSFYSSFSYDRQDNSYFDSVKIPFPEGCELFREILKTQNVSDYRNDYNFRYNKREPENLPYEIHKDELQMKIHLSYFKKEISYEFVNQEGSTIDFPRSVKIIPNALIAINEEKIYLIQENSQQIPMDVHKLIADLQFNNKLLGATDEHWDQIKTYLAQKVPLKLLSGDDLSQDVITLPMELEVYFKWSKTFESIEGLVWHRASAIIPGKIIDYDSTPLDMLVNFLDDLEVDFDKESWTFILTKEELFKLCPVLNEKGINAYFKDQKISSLTSINYSASYNIDWLELNPELHFENQLDHVSMAKILKQLDLATNTVNLGNNTLGLIPTEWLKKISLLQKHGKLQKDGSLRMHPAKALLLEKVAAGQDLSKDIMDFIQKLKEFQKISPKEVSKNFLGSLRTYQKLSLGWFEFLENLGFGGCLADDMGLGKTVQVIAWLSHKLSKNKNLKVLIVCPKSLTSNWQREIARFCPKLSSFRWDQAQLDKNDYQKFHATIVSYQLLQRQNILDYEFDYLILDEAQTVKNANTNTYAAVACIKAKHKLALTGTPIENHVGELMNIFNLLTPEIFAHKDLKNFEKADSLDFIKPFLLRRTKDEVLSDLPAKNIQTIFCEPNKTEQQQYLTIHQSLKTQLEENLEGSDFKFNFLQVLMKLRQAACHLQLIDPNYDKDSTKLETLKELVGDIHHGKNKVVIFSQFTRLLKIARRELAMDDSNSCYLDGQTQNREKVINIFQNSPDHHTFFISIKAGGTGLNLTCANYCIILDPWWNPAVESQAIDRIHRIGQTQKVFAYKLITKNTIEEKVALLQEQKQKLYDRYLESNEGFIRNLSKEQMQELLM